MNQVNAQHVLFHAKFSLEEDLDLEITSIWLSWSHTLSVSLVFLDNVKAYYRRAKAHVGAWNPDDAKQDFQKCLELDKSLTKSVQHDLEQLNEEIKLNDVETKLRYKNLFS